MPNVNEYETEAAWMEACVPTRTDEGDCTSWAKFTSVLLLSICSCNVGISCTEVSCVIIMNAPHVYRGITIQPYLSY